MNTSSVKKIVSVAKTCKKAFSKCLRRVRKFKLFGSKRSKSASDIMKPEKENSLAIVSSVHQESIPIPVDICDEKLKNKKTARRLRRRKNCKLPKTEDVLDSKESGRVKGNPSDITLTSSLKNEGEPRNSRVAANNKQSKDAEKVFELREIFGKVRKQHASHSDKISCTNERRSVNKPERTRSKQTKKSILLQSEDKTDCEKKQTDEFNESCEDIAVTKSSRLLECGSSDNIKKTKRLRRRKNNKSVTEKAQKTECVLDTDESVRVIGNRSNIAQSIFSNNEDLPCKSQVMVVGKQEETGDNSEIWKLVAKRRKQREGRSDDKITCAKEQRHVTKPDQIKSYDTKKPLSVRFERRTDCEKKPANELKNHKNTTINKSSGMSNYSSLRKLTNHVKIILKEMTPQNITILSKNFANLPIDTMEHLENTVNLVFEKAILNQNFAQLCAKLCSAMQSVNVISDNRKITTSFQLHILRKCQSSFEADKVQRTVSVEKLEEIKSCRDLTKRKQLQFSYDESEKRLLIRSLGNCRFIGALFKQRILKTSIMEYCITSLANQQSESSLECLYSLLKTSEKEWEQCCNLNETFEKLKALTSEINISSRIRLVIQEIMNLRRTDNRSDV